jgi:hypothetical protein
MDELRDLLVSFGYGMVGGIWKAFHSRQLERDQKARLVSMLNNPKYPWRSVSVLSANIAADRATTKALLAQVNARQQEKPPYYWGLIDRVGEA